MASQRTIDQVLGVFQFLALATTSGDPEDELVDLTPPSAERAERIADEIESGERNILDVRNDLIKFIADQRPGGAEDVAATIVRNIFGDPTGERGGALEIGTSQETESERIDRIVSEVLQQTEGDIDVGRTFASVIEALAPFRPGTQAPPTTEPTEPEATETTGGGTGPTIGGVSPQTDPPGATGSVTDQPGEFGGTIIPSGTRVLRVLGDHPGDAAEFYLQADLFGQTVSFLVGDREDFDELFPGGFDDFGGFDEVTRRQFVNSPSFELVAGTVDQYIGAEESLAVQVQRDLDALGLESIPQWMRDDPRAMLALVTATAQGWSPGRLGETLRETAGFSRRFPGFSDFWDDDRETFEVALTRWVGLEQDFVGMLRQFRGPDTNVSIEYVGNLIASGWGTGEVGAILDAERQLFNNPEAFENLQQIMSFQDQEILDPDDFISLVAGSPFERFEQVNDALRQAALSEQGIDISTDLAVQLGEGSSLGIAGAGAFTEQARATAMLLAQNRSELDRGAFGITRDTVLATVFNDPDLLPSGQTIAEADLQLQQIARERSIAAQGTGGLQGFIDARGRLRLQGLASL